MADKSIDKTVRRLTSLERAVVEAAVRAAEVWGADSRIGGIAAVGGELENAVYALINAREQMLWTRRPLIDVRAGDRIRVPDQAGTERTIAKVARWDGHVRPCTHRAGERYCEECKYNPTALDHTYLRVRFEDTPDAEHRMDPRFEVEIEQPAAVVLLLAEFGWENRVS